MKKLLIILQALILITQFCYGQTINKDSLQNIQTIGVFKGEKIFVGNFEREEVYTINEFNISLAELSDRLVDSLKGKKVLVSGKLKIVEGKYESAKSSADGKIYEPYKEPDKKFIIKPTFTIVYDTREPLLEHAK